MRILCKITSDRFKSTVWMLQLFMWFSTLCELRVFLDWHWSHERSIFINVECRTIYPCSLRSSMKHSEQLKSVLFFLYLKRYVKISIANKLSNRSIIQSIELNISECILCRFNPFHAVYIQLSTVNISFGSLAVC